MDNQFKPPVPVPGRLTMSQPPSVFCRNSPPQQHGFSLLELLVGLTIGLMTIATALGSLLVSRNITAAITDSSRLHQQAAYAFRVIGQQLRQAGSLRLNSVIRDGTATASTKFHPVAFEIQAGDFLPGHVIRGKDNPGIGEYALSIRYHDDIVSLYIDPPRSSLQRDCLGNKGHNMQIESHFVLRQESNGTPSLYCAGGSSTPQPIVRNVANFQVRYLLQTTSSGTTHIQYVNAATVSNGSAANWAHVLGVEICLVLFSDEMIDQHSDSNNTVTYIDCDGKTSINTADSNLPPLRQRRMHAIFRHVYQLRSQGTHNLQ